MAGARGRLGRFTEAVLGGARAARDKALELRDEFRTSDEPERALVAPLLPRQEVRYVGLAPVRAPELHRAGSQLTDAVAGELAEALDPRALFNLLNIVNPVVWVDAVMTPVRLAAGVLLLPGKAVALAADVAEEAVPDEPAPAPREAEARPPVPLTPEQEAFRALFRLNRHRPLADQLAEIAYRRRYVFSGDLTTLAGSLLLFLERYTGTPLAVTDTHLHLLRMGRRPDEGRPDRRQPRLLWSVERSRVARIDSDHGLARLTQFPSTIVFDDGSWIRIVNPATRDDQSRFLAAIRDIPGQRPAG
ncbi:hypothetical protein GA0074695_4630 [Micromonospora viridifaciens]|uniref:Uncharacterized protein n=1 Tax=Micromonospora viridifaciens TaxID=1881 RepID=A0A1C4YSC0_MICVI|nr:hypothetical protein [Micromonospora viridifaciens]SCF23649.1 hypothetical protein GA0074695_4630 [Micromonospora viridifaciens]